MSDITKIRELHTKDPSGGGWDDWPYPTVETTSVVTGKLRDRILAKIGVTSDESVGMFLVETYVSGGYSEFTREDEISIVVTYRSEEVFRAGCGFNSEQVMARFLKWVDEP